MVFKMFNSKQIGNMALAVITIVLTVNARSAHGQAYLFTLENSFARTLDNNLKLNQTETQILNEREDNTTKIIIYKNIVENSSNELSQTAMDVITIIWYVATFMALAAFFMLMACSDRRCRNREAQRNANISDLPMPPPTPAPSYSEFAPPSYDTVIKMQHAAKASIFVIPFATIEMAKDEANNNSGSNNNSNNNGNNTAPQTPSNTPAVNLYTINELQKSSH